MLDFEELADVWLCTSDDANCWDSDYDLSQDGQLIDPNDLLVFAEDWLWMSCDYMKETQMEPMMMQMGMGGGMYMEAAPVGLTALDERAALREEIINVGESIEWCEKIWAEDEEVRKEFTEKEWAEFTDSLEDTFEDLKSQWSEKE